MSLLSLQPNRMRYLSLAPAHITNLPFRTKAPTGNTTAGYPQDNGDCHIVRMGLRECRSGFGFDKALSLDCQDPKGLLISNSLVLFFPVGRKT
jgi:hypothetical protein